MGFAVSARLGPMRLRASSNAISLDDGSGHRFPAGDYPAKKGRPFERAACKSALERITEGEP